MANIVSLPKTPLGFPFPKGSALTQLFSSELHKLSETGSVQRMVQKHLGNTRHTTCGSQKANEQRPLGYENVFLPFALLLGIVFARYTVYTRRINDCMIMQCV